MLPFMAFSTPSTSQGAVEFKKDIPSLVDKSPCKSGGSTSSSSNASDMRLKYALIPSCEVTVPWTTSDSSSTGSPAPKKGRYVLTESELEKSLDEVIVPIKSESESEETKRRKRTVKMMHSYSHSPSHSTKQLTIAKTKCKTLQGHVYNERRKVQRLRKKVNSLRQIISVLKQKDMISSDGSTSLEKSISGIPSSIIRRYIINSRRCKPSRQKYPQELRSFALTLHFYSPKAYDYVRNTFALCLPDPSTIRSWYYKIDCSPGYCEPAFQQIKNKVETSDSPILCSLVLDEMAIKKKVEVVGSKVYGYVDMGSELEDDSLSEASNALVYMAVGINGNWKVPIAYFLIKSLTGSEKAHIANECIIKLAEVGASVSSITCDGPASHFSMMKELGCNINDLNNLQTYFPHPRSPEKKIYFLLDACHMLKLIRNHLHKLQVIKNANGEEICWKYIKLLHEIQDREELAFGNKLTQRHVDWQRQKMKVKLAAQTLSQSTADAIKFLQLDMKLPEFQGAGPTVEFLEIFDGVFDYLNSRNPFARGTKSALRRVGEPYFRPFLEKAIHYISSLTDVSGRSLLTTPKKTPFIGFIITIKSVLGIYDTYVKPENALLQYLLTYKLSQDHLELFFCWIRSRHGFDNNPTCFQFISTFKRLLLHHDIKKITGNCVPLDSTSILNISSHRPTNTVLVNASDINSLRRYNLDYQSTLNIDIPNIQHNPSLSDYIKNVVNYISGYVVAMTKKRVRCVTCLDSLECTMEAMDDTHMALLNRKNKGGLVRPSSTVRTICLLWETHIREIMRQTDNKIPPEISYQKYVSNIIINSLLPRQDIFPELQDHFSDTSFDEECHKKKLIETVGLSYCRIRMHHLARKHSERISGPVYRQLYNKLVLFKHQ